MNRRSFLRTTAQGLTACLCALHAIAQSAESNPPNIILIMTDDQGYGDIGAHGNSMIRTPNLDAFTQESLEMTRFYVEPVCSPTRASLMTGRYHMRTGVYATSRGGARIFGDEVTVADLLARGGYRTGIFGKWHLGDNYPSRPQDKGFQETLIHLSGAIGGVPDRGPSYSTNMKGTRDFQTAPIHLGTENENPSRLSRYQEGQNLTGTGPVDGWLVKITRTGRYQLKLQWPPHRGGALYVKWLGVEHHLPLEGNHFSAQLALNAGTGLLDVGFEDEQGRRLVDPWDNKTRGDVIVLRLDDRL